MERRKFTNEFKQEAVKLVRAQGMSVSQASRDLGVCESSMHRWLAQAKEDLLDPQSTASQEHEELKRLRRENAELRMEREILKKATAFFAKLEK